MSTITTTRKDLLALLKKTAPVTTESGLMSILAAVRISTFRGRARLEATNLSVWRTLDLPGKVAGRQPSVAVRAKQLRSLVTNVVGGDELVLDVGPGGLAIWCAGTTVHLDALPGEWPAPPEVSGYELKLSAHDVGRLRRVATAASGDEARPILTGILLDGGFAVATDSYRLAVARIDAVPPAPLLFPAAGAADLPADGATLTIDTEGPRVAWTGGEAGEDFHVGYLIEGDFPSWEKLLPPKPKAVVVAEREPLRRVVTQAVKTNAALAQTDMPVRLDRVDDTTLAVQLNAAGRGTAVMTASAPCPKVWKAWKTMAFNPEFLAAGLAMLEGEHVRIEAVDPLKPALLRDEADKAGELRYLLMPVRVS